LLAAAGVAVGSVLASTPESAVMIGNVAGGADFPQGAAGSPTK